MHRFHHHDGVIYDNTDRQHEREQRKQVDGETEKLQKKEGADDGHRNRDRRDQRTPDILQKEEHHDKHQHKGLKQRMQHLVDRRIQEVLGVVHDRRMQTLWQLLLELVDQLLGFDKDVIGVRAGYLEDGDTGGRMPVQLTVGRIRIAAELYPGHIFQPHHGTVGIGLDDNVFVVLDLVQLTLVLQDIFEDFLAALPQTTGSCFETLVLDGGGNFHGAEVIGRKPVGLQPDSHGIILGAEGLCITYSGDPLQLGDQVYLDIVLQKSLIIGAIRGVHADEHDDTVLLLLRRDPGLDHLLRDLARGLGDTVLYVHRRNIRVGTLFEINGQLHAAVIARVGGHVSHVLHPIDRLFQRRSHRPCHDFSIGAGIVRGYQHTGRRDIREQCNGQRKDGKTAK